MKNLTETQDRELKNIYRSAGEAIQRQRADILAEVIALADQFYLQYDNQNEEFEQENKKQCTAWRKYRHDTFGIYDPIELVNKSREVNIAYKKAEGEFERNCALRSEEYFKQRNKLIDEHDDYEFGMMDELKAIREKEKEKAKRKAQDYLSTNGWSEFQTEDMVNELEVQFAFYFEPLTPFECYRSVSEIESEYRRTPAPEELH